MTSGISNDYYTSSMNYAINRKRNYKGNFIKYLIPGLQNTIEIPFPDHKLPVCKRCKKNYKTRELCRERDSHTDLPWKKTYICVTLDDSCFDQDVRGDLRLVKEDSMEFIARSLPGPPMPYRAKKCQIRGAEAPICMACKDKNYTKYHCREKQKHQQLPYNTTYVLLSATPRASENDIPWNISYRTYNTGSKRPASEISVSSSCFSVHKDASASKKIKSDVCSTATSDTSASIEEEVILSDDIHKIEHTHAFLMKVQMDHSCELRWLEADPFVPRSKDGSSWDNQSNSVDQVSFCHPASQFGSHAYSLPSDGWLGSDNNIRSSEQWYTSGWNGSMERVPPKIPSNHSSELNGHRNSEQFYHPEWNSSMVGGPPKLPMNHSNEFNGPASKSSCDNCEHHNSHFSGMQPHAMNFSYVNKSSGRYYPMYSEDENFIRSNWMYQPVRKNLNPQGHHERFNRNYQSHLEQVNSEQYMNQEYGWPGSS